MAKRNGGIIGPSNVPNPFIAKGTWKLSDAFNYIKAGLWPPVLGYQVNNSLRFNSGSSDSLTRTPASAGNRQKWTWSCWLKKSNLSSRQNFFQGGNHLTGSNSSYFEFSSADVLRIAEYNGSVETYNIDTTQVFRDVSAFYHIVIAFDTTQATASNRVKLYVNGNQVTSFSASNYPTQNLNTSVNNNVVQNIGRDPAGGFAINGYMSEIYMIDGQQLTPSSFGETDTATGIWTPKAYTGTYGTNGFYLKFANSAALGTDSSGNGNNFTVNNLTSVDQSTDTCTNNFATFNSLQSALNGNSTVQTFSEGNLQTVTPNTVYSKFGGASTIGASKSKWYAEIKVSSTGGTYPTYQSIGITGDPSYNANTTSAYIGGQSYSAGYYNQGGLVQVNNATVLNTGVTKTAPYTVMIAMDLDNNYVYFGIDGTWLNSGIPTSGSSGTGGFTIPASSTVPNGNYFFACADGSSQMTSTYQANFGNPPYSVTSGYTDAGGFGNFSYQPPSGYYALCTRTLAIYG